ncbi:MAG: CDP-alcohol phosphatidyltransferase family protein [Anaerolineaceae bacterium]
MANIITLSRFPLLLLYVLLIFLGDSTAHFWCVPLIIFIILLDTVDGYVARRFKLTSLLGSALDIAADRTVELVLWIIFSNLGLISVVVPLIVAARDISVDAVRSVGMSKGLAPFDQVKNPVSRFLVATPIMRTSYAVSKVIAFVMLTLTLAFQSAGSPVAAQLQSITQIFVWIAVGLCLVRGIPVLAEGYKLLAAYSNKD